MKKKPKNIIYWFEQINIKEPIEGQDLNKNWWFRCKPQNENYGWYSQGFIDEKRIKELLTEKQFMKFKRGCRVFIKEITREMRYQSIKKRYMPREKRLKSP
jgi:hypothetical protein